MADGTLTQDQADKVVVDLDARLPHGPGGHGGLRSTAAGLDAAATALGITADELRTELADGRDHRPGRGGQGRRRADRDRRHGRRGQDRLDEEVAAGELTQEEADGEAGRACTERITDSVNNGMPARERQGPR